MLAKLFHTIDHYDSQKSSNYRLLPFNFTSLDGNKYVVSNLAGEYITLEREALYAFAEGKLDQESTQYLELKSRHFLIDDDSNVALELLALKYRTKVLPLSNFTALHIFVVTLRCDYSCPYCQVSRQTEDRQAYDMPLSVAIKSLELTFRSPSPNLKIEFQGGESLLNFDLIKFIVYEAKRINESEKRNLDFVIATNLSLLNDEMLDFCVKNDIYISTSLDGPEKLHNANRPRPGKNGYQLTVDGIRRAQKYLGKDYVSALMTTTAPSLSMYKDIIDEYVSLGFNSIFLRPISPYGFAIKTHQTEKYNAEQWLNFYVSGLDYIIEINKKGYPFVEQYTSIVLNKMLTPFSGGYVDLQSPSGIGVSAVVYNYDGDVYASDESRMLAEMGDKSFKLGNVMNDSYEDIFLSDTLLDIIEATVLESVPVCSECAFRPFCGSDPNYHYATQKDFIGNKSRSGFCHKNISIFRHLIKLMKSDSDSRSILLSWIRRS